MPVLARSQVLVSVTHEQVDGPAWRHLWGRREMNTIELRLKIFISALVEKKDLSFGGALTPKLLTVNQVIAGGELAKIA